MTDIVEMLRSDGDDERQRFREARATLGSLLANAANEIERLRAALVEIRDAGPMTLDDQRWRIALAALEGK